MHRGWLCSLTMFIASLLITLVASQAPVCNLVSTRKNINDLNDKEFKKYINAINKLRKGVRYGESKITWAQLAQGYTNAKDWRVEDFVEFNRMHLATVENALQKVNQRVTIPFWVPSKNDDPVFSNKRLGTMWKGEKCISGPLRKMTFKPKGSASQCLVRYDGGINLTGNIFAQQVENIDHDFVVFAGKLYQEFDRVSQKLGGTYELPLAAYDPLFLSHMAYLDANWAIWQNQSHARKGGELTYELGGTNPKLLKDKRTNKAYTEMLRSRRCITYRSNDGFGDE